MKKNIIKSVALSLVASLVLSGCGDDSVSEAQSDPLELESDGKTLVFYSASANEHYAFDVDTQAVTNLNSSSDEEMSNYKMESSEKGKLFVWIDNKGDNNASNDEGKIVMLKQNYSYAVDGNATWEDFYYLGHFHEEEGHHHLAAHSNSEFNVTSGAKYDAMVRLNQFLAEQYTLEQNLSATIPSEANGLCGFHTFVNEESETFYYAMGKNGTMYVYDENIASLADSVAVADNCTPNEMGMSSTQDGVLLFLKETQKVYSVDSHDDGAHHVHHKWDVSRLIGSGKSAEMMVGIAPLAQ